jgi:hypothetical protein
MKKKKKRKAGVVSTSRGSKAAALDARGAAQGGIGLMCFAIVVWKMAPAWNGALTLLIALAAWLAVSLLIWIVRKHLHVKLH